MKSIAIIVGEGFEEIEFVTVVDILKRAQVRVEVFSLGDLRVTGGHGITIFADDVYDYYSTLSFDGIVLVGGMNNARLLSEDSSVLKLIEYYTDEGRLVAGICATPALVFSKCGVLSGREYTCYPDDSFISMVDGVFVDKDVVESDNIITSQSPYTSLNFALAILEKLGYDSQKILSDLKGK